jgi:hypothetical protein
MASGSIYKLPLSRIRRREAIGLPPLPLTKTQNLTKLAEKTNTLSLLRKPKQLIKEGKKSLLHLGGCITP